MLLSDKEIVWINGTPNSPETVQPLFIIREKETDEEIMRLVIHLTDTARYKFNTEGLLSSRLQWL